MILFVIIVFVMFINEVLTKTIWKVVIWKLFTWKLFTWKRRRSYEADMISSSRVVIESKKVPRKITYLLTNTLGTLLNLP